MRGKAHAFFRSIMNEGENGIAFLTEFWEKLFTISEKSFEEAAMRLFRWQAVHIPVYASYIKHLGIQRENIDSIADIPFLPIRFFKSHPIFPVGVPAQGIFESSRTTGQTPSTQFVYQFDWYEQVCLKGFELFYGPVSNYRFLFLLPGYAERSNSSLIYMAKHLAEKAGQTAIFYLHDFEALSEEIDQTVNQPTMLLGVTFALLDFAEHRNKPLPKQTLVMETGGMKGRGVEPIREQLHQCLCERFGLDTIHSEYGMTELMSQAYSTSNGHFACPPWMRMVIREPNDPFTIAQHGQAGGINVIDLANISGCAFIETQDLGRMLPNNTFEVLGRFDVSETRGCSLLAA